MMNRIETVREYVDATLLRMEDHVERRRAHVHLYGVAQLCGLIALKRGHDPEIPIITGMLHDIYSYVMLDTTDHARKGAVMVRDILDALQIMTGDETRMICHAISVHSDKAADVSGLDAILIDADVFQHYLYDPSIIFTDPARHQRCENLKKELGIDSHHQQRLSV